VTDIAEVRALVLQLPEKDRADLAHHLLLSLEPDAVADGDAMSPEWEAEIDKRLQTIAEGKHIARDWREAMHDLREKLCEERKS
jgi:hypothetical protein